MIKVYDKLNQNISLSIILDQKFEWLQISKINYIDILRKGDILTNHQNTKKNTIYTYIITIYRILHIFEKTF